MRELLGFDTYNRVSIYHKRWVEDYLGNGKNTRDDKWTKSIAACPVNCLSIFNRGRREKSFVKNKIINGDIGHRAKKH